LNAPFLPPERARFACVATDLSRTSVWPSSRSSAVPITGQPWVLWRFRRPTGRQGTLSYQRRRSRIYDGAEVRCA